MTYVKAYVSPRARKYLATAAGRRKLLTLLFGKNRKIYPLETSPADSTGGGIGARDKR